MRNQNNIIDFRTSHYMGEQNVHFYSTVGGGIQSQQIHLIKIRINWNFCFLKNESLFSLFCFFPGKERERETCFSTSCASAVNDF